VSEPVVAADVQTWAAELDAVAARLAPLFARSEPRHNAAAYLRALLGDAERKNSWQAAEYAGLDAPYPFQHLLGRADWDAEAARDLLRGYAWEHLADPDGGVLVIDETGFLKKGVKSAGVQRQYSGTAGRIENCQIGVFLAYTGRHGRALIDRELYLPKGWAHDADRRQQAGIPPEVPFATKPELGRRMLARAWAAGVRPRWVTADEVYGNDSKFRRFLEQNGQPYVLAVQSNQRLWVGLRQLRVDQIADGLPRPRWRRGSAGEGSKGPRRYDWAWEPIGKVDPRGWRLWLLVRRQQEAPHERAYYLCRGPARTRRRELIGVAGARWPIEECFERGKGECGLDHYEVRSWVGWYRHVTLSMLALALLAVVRRQAASSAPPLGEKGGGSN
jgi:SRSO17 transposase